VATFDKYDGHLGQLKSGAMCQEFELDQETIAVRANPPEINWKPLVQSCTGMRVTKRA
jgi:hypothetical protein